MSAEPEAIDAAAVHQYIVDTFQGLDISEHLGDYFYFYDPDRKIPPRQRMPFATLVNGDSYDTCSNLARPGVYRLNIGVSKETYRALFGPQPAFPDGNGVVDTGHDFSALDVVMPHPVYASASWICVLNPRPVTFKTVCRYLAEAYELAVDRHANFAGGA